ncbi:hypothetical protein pb186bvf_013196 [Paramecium bursaria]
MYKNQYQIIFFIIQIKLQSQRKTMQDCEQNYIINTKKKLQFIHISVMILYKNAVYQGLTQNNIRNGYGICWWFNGSIYIGEWQDDQIHGDGFLFDNGSSYKAQFKNNKTHGYCLNEGSYLNYQFGWLNGTNIINEQIIEYYRGEQKLSNSSFQIEEIKDQYTNGLLDFIEISERNQYYKIDQVNDYLGFKDGIGISLFNKQNYMIGIAHSNSTKLCQYQKGDDFYTGLIKNGNFEGHGIYYISSKSKMIEGLFKDGKCIQILEIYEGDKQVYQQISLKIILNYFESINLKTCESRVQMPFFQKPQIIAQTQRESSKSTPYVKQVHFSIDELQTFRDTSESNRHSIQPAKSVVDLNQEDKSPLKEKNKNQNEKLEISPINVCKRDKEINPQSHRLPIQAISNKVKKVISIKRIK